MAHGLAFSSLAALAPRMLVLRISRRSLSLAPRNAIKSPVFFYSLGPGSRSNPAKTVPRKKADILADVKAYQAFKGTQVDGCYPVLEPTLH